MQKTTSAYQQQFRNHVHGAEQQPGLQWVDRLSIKTFAAGRTLKWRKATGPASRWSIWNARQIRGSQYRISSSSFPKNYYTSWVSESADSPIMSHTPPLKSKCCPTLLLRKRNAAVNGCIDRQMRFDQWKIIISTDQTLQVPGQEEEAFYSDSAHSNTVCKKCHFRLRCFRIDIRKTISQCTMEEWWWRGRKESSWRRLFAGPVKKSETDLKVSYTKITNNSNDGQRLVDNITTCSRTTWM